MNFIGWTILYGEPLLKGTVVTQEFSPIHTEIFLTVQWETGEQTLIFLGSKNVKAIIRPCNKPKTDNRIRTIIDGYIPKGGDL